MAKRSFTCNQDKDIFILTLHDISGMWQWWVLSIFFPSPPTHGRVDASWMEKNSLWVYHLLLHLLWSIVTISCWMVTHLDLDLFEKVYASWSFLKNSWSFSRYAGITSPYLNRGGLQRKSLSSVVENGSGQMVWSGKPFGAFHKWGTQ